MPNLNKKLQIEVKLKNPREMENLSDLILFGIKYVELNDYPDIKTEEDYKQFKANNEVLHEIPVYEDEMGLTLEQDDNTLVGYMFTTQERAKSYFCVKDYSIIKEEDIINQYDYEINACNEFLDEEIFEVNLKVVENGKESDVESLVSSESDIGDIIVGSDSFDEYMKKEHEKIKVLVKEPYKEPYVKVIEKDLENYQEIVGGLIECVEMPNVKGVDLYVNEEGKLQGLQGNFWLPEYEDCVVGTCYMVGYNANTGDNVSITEQQISNCKKYIEHFKIPNDRDLYRDFDELQNYMKLQEKKYKRQTAEM